MKLPVATVDYRDSDNVMSALMDEYIGVTCIGGTGGLIVPGNSTLLIGVDEAHVPQIRPVIAE